MSGLLVAAAMLTGAAAAVGDPVHVRSPVALSGAAGDTIPNFDSQTCPTGGREGEVSLAVDPDNSDRLVASWMQRVVPNPPNPEVFVADVVAYSDNGGQTWSRTGVTGMSGCSEDPGMTQWCPGFDRPADSNIDPWLAIGRDGISYLASMGGYGLGQAGGANQTQANVSGDGGATWSDVSIPECPEGGNDFAEVVADPTLPGHAYIVYIALGRGGDYMARTVDGGENWRKDALPVAPASVHQLVVLPGNTCQVSDPPETPARSASCEMVLVFSGVTTQDTDPTTVFTQRSTNGGLTWSAPRQLAVLPAKTLVRATAGPNEDTADPNDEIVYISWWNGGKAEIVRSEGVGPDGNIVWSAPIEVTDANGTNTVGRRPGPTVAVDSSGTVGVLSYDARHDTNGSGTAPNPTELWFAHSHDHGDTWTEEQVVDAGDTAVLTPGGVVPNESDFGSYISLVPLSDGFGAAFVGVPNTPGNKTDIFYSHIRKPTCHGRLATIVGTNASETLTGTAGDDVIVGLAGNDVISGGGGNDRICAGAGRDTLSGGDGNDLLNGGSGPDSLAGDGGNDRAMYSTSTSAVTVDIDGVADDGNSTDGPAGARDNVRTDVESLTGSRYDDSLTGSASSNRITGGLGADSLFGLGGNDVLFANDGSADSEINCDGGTGDSAHVDTGTDPSPIDCEAVGP